MSAGKWHSRFRKDREINPAFADFDLGDIADRAVLEALRKLQWELSKLHKGCHIIQYGLRAECWGPEIAEPVFGPAQAEAGQFIPVYTRAYAGSQTITVWLPDARDSRGEIVEVKDVDGNAGSRNITIRTLGTDQPGGTFALQKIDGATSLIINSNYGSAQLRSDGINWHLLSGAGTVSLPEDLTNIANAWTVDVSGNVSGVGAVGSAAITSTGSIKSTSASGGVGYGTGAGGTVTQGTSKSTSVTLDKVCGTITTHNENLVAGTSVGFRVSNSTVAATDSVVVSLQQSGASDASYELQVYRVSAGGFAILIHNITGGDLAEALLINFAVIKGVTS